LIGHEAKPGTQRLQRNATRSRSDYAGAVDELDVRVVSPEEAADGVAELWSGGTLFGITLLEAGEVVLRIEPRPDGQPVVVGARRLRLALEQARDLLEVD
jgi:hypothetical protein